MRSSARRYTDPAHWGVAVLLLLIAAGLLIPHLDRPLKYDERYTLEHFAPSLDRALFAYSEPNNHILHSTLVWAMTAVGGESRLVARLPALGAGLVAIALAYRVAFHTGGVETGAAAAALLGSATGFAEYAINARGYTLTIALALLLAERLLTPHRALVRGRWSLLVLAAALVLTLPSMIVLIAGAALWLIWQNRPADWRAAWRLLRPLIAGSACAGAIYLPPLLRGDLSTAVDRFGLDSPLALASDLGGLVFGTPGVNVIFGLGGLIGAIVLVSGPGLRPLRRWTVAVLGSAALLALAQWALTGRTFYARNYLYLLAVLCPVAGIGMQRIFGHRTPWIAAGLLLASAIPFAALS